MKGDLTELGLAGDLGVVVMAKVDLVNIFLASPGDVAHERQIVKEVIEAINRTIGREKDIRFEIIGWDTDSYPAYGKDAQAIVNEQIADMTKFELFVGIMWNRFGTATPRAGSGTEEEFRQAVESLEKTGRPAIMFYFNQEAFNPKSAYEAEQKLKVLKFKEGLQEKGLTAEYNGQEKFRELFRTHLESWLIKHSASTFNPPHVELTQVNPPEKYFSPVVHSVPEVINNSGMWVMLKSNFSIASEVNESGDRKVNIKIPVTEVSEDASFRSLQPTQYGRQELVQFAHQNTGAIAKVVEAKRSSTGDGAVWEVALELGEVNSGFGIDMAYGGTSADQIAMLRARYILLNEEPVRPGCGSRNDVLENGLFTAIVQGVSTTVKVTGSVLPSMWKEIKGDTSKFLPIARLWSVFHLITSNTCEHILDLKLGPIKGDGMHVEFRGRRKKEYSNVDAFVIEFEGDCNLNS